MKLENAPIKPLISAVLKAHMLGWGMVLLFVVLNVFGALTLKNQVQKLSSYHLATPRIGISFLIELITSGRTFIAIGSLFMATVAWTIALANLELSKAYPVAIGCNFLFVMASTALFYQEPMNLLKILGVILILAGIVLVLKS